MKIICQERLVERFPALVGKLPWVALDSFPTPVTKASRLSEALGLELWVKHDDENMLGYGGNKVRKLELLLGEALAQGARRVLTVGGLGSNHVVATAFYARMVGLGCDALLTPQAASSNTSTNMRAAAALGANLIPLASWTELPRALMKLTRRLGSDVYIIGPGGSSPRGTIGYLVAALELAAQVAAGDCPEPGTIVVPLGSGGTAAGLLAGLAQTPLQSRILAVRTVNRLFANHYQTARLANQTLKLLQKLGAQPRPLDPARLEVDDGFFGDGYGVPTPESEKSVILAEKLEGWELETTYTGKTLAVLITNGQAWRPPVLWWNTFSSKAKLWK